MIKKGISYDVGRKMSKPSYIVELIGTDHRMPSQCICCGSPKIHYEEKSFCIAQKYYSKGAKTTIESTHVQTRIPVCDACMRHQEEYASRFTKGCWTSVLSVILAFATFVPALIAEAWLVAIALGLLLISPSAILFLHSRRFRERILREGHSHTNPLAILADIEPIGPSRERRWAFKFKSDSFARAFAEANNASPEADGRFVSRKP